MENNSVTRACLRRSRRMEEQGIPLVLCEVCKMKVRRLVGHVKLHGLTTAQYQSLYPNSPIYPEDWAVQAGKTRSNSFKSGKIISYRKGQTKETHEGIKKGAQALSKLKKGKTTSEKFTTKGLIPWNKDLPKDHPHIQKMSILATKQLSWENRITKHYYREDLGMHFRSKLEANIARIFKYEGCRFLYEPEVFHLEDGTRYTPDFKDLDGLFVNGFMELKGWILSTTKPDLLRKSGIDILFLPQQTKVWRILCKTYAALIPEWEFYKNQKLIIPKQELSETRRLIGKLLTEFHVEQGNKITTCLFSTRPNPIPQTTLPQSDPSPKPALPTLETLLDSSILI